MPPFALDAYRKRIKIQIENCCLRTFGPLITGAGVLRVIVGWVTTFGGNLFGLPQKVTFFLVSRCSIGRFLLLKRPA